MLRRSTTKNGILVPHNPSNQFQCFVAIVCLGRLPGPVQYFTCQIGCCGRPKLADEGARQRQATGPLIIRSNIGRLKSKIYSPRWAVGLIRTHDLLAEQEPRMAREFDPSLGAKADGRPVDDHELALAKLKY